MSFVFVVLFSALFLGWGFPVRATDKLLSTSVNYIGSLITGLIPPKTVIMTVGDHVLFAKNLRLDIFKNCFNSIKGHVYYNASAHVRTQPASGSPQSGRLLPRSCPAPAPLLPRYRGRVASSSQLKLVATMLGFDAFMRRAG